MQPNQLQALLGQSEGYNLEFKESYSKDIASEICAFANAAGGTMLIGVTDDGIVKGVHYNNDKASRLQQSLAQINPPLQVRITPVEDDGKTVVVVSCASGPQKPYIVSGSIYVRQGPNAQKLTSAEEMRDFFQKSDRIYFDEADCRSFKYPEDFDSEGFGRFLDLAGIRASLDEKTLLENLQLFTQEGHLKNAAVLFFARNAQKFIDTAAIRCVLFKGTNKRYILDDKVMEGTLLDQYEAAMAYLKSKLQLRYDIEGQGSGPRKEHLEVPEIALKEALVNSILCKCLHNRAYVNRNIM